MQGHRGWENHSKKNNQEMKRFIITLMRHHMHRYNSIGKAALLALLAILLMPATMLSQTQLWISGSAVPGGTQPLTRFITNTSGKYTFKYHGKLLPGKLYVQTTESRNEISTSYFAPRQVDANIVNNGISYASTRDTTDAAWTVLFDSCQRYPGSRNPIIFS